MKKIILTLAVFTVSISFCFADFYLITVTQRDAVNVGAPKDEGTIKVYAKEIANVLGERFVHHSYGKDEFSTSTLEELGISSNDVVWFNYSGHSRTYDGFPMVDRIIQIDIYKSLKRKANFTLCTWDGCNIGQPLTDLAFLSSRPPSMTQNIRRLFAASKGGVIAAASQTSQPSWGSKELGGIFTNSFVEALRRVTYESQAATWEEVKAKAEEITQQTARQANRTQSPKILVQLSTRQGTQSPQTPETHNAPTTKITVHVIKKGDTYESIAKQYQKYDNYAHLTATLLRSYNNNANLREEIKIFLIPSNSTK